ncbi:MAG TPA: hypothetical protein VJP80_06440 [Candidatus Saccharimonadales bacterium]|nr:hypothetical protein [Candidatus Saccharimonadales bacterium]
MSDNSQHTSQSNPWYKKWWGIILAIIIWPFFLTWFVWSKTKWRNLAKVGATLGIGIASLMSLSVMAAGQPTPVDTPKTVSSTQSSSNTTKPAKQTTTPTTQTQASKTTTSIPTPQPTVSLATLEAQGKVTLTGATKRFEDYYAKVQSDATQSDAANSSSAFNNDKWNSDLTPLNQGTTDYNTVANSYYNAHQIQPDSLDNWNTDSQQVYTDTTNWIRDEWQLLADQTQSNPTDSDNTKVSADEQAYDADLAKTKADINQL